MKPRLMLGSCIVCVTCAAFTPLEAQDAFAEKSCSFQTVQKLPAIPNLAIKSVSISPYAKEAAARTIIDGFGSATAATRPIDAVIPFSFAEMEDVRRADAQGRYKEARKLAADFLISKISGARLVEVEGLRAH